MAQLINTICIPEQQSESASYTLLASRGINSLHRRYFMASLGFHLIALLMLMILGARNARHKEAVIIDFDLSEPAPQCSRIEKKASAAAECSQAVSPPASQPALQPPLQQAVMTRAAEPPPALSSASVQSVSAPTVTSAVVKAGIGVGREVSMAGSQQAAVPNVGAGTVSDREYLVEQKKKKYLKEHFEYIRELVTKKLSYPAVARRMEWSGKVVLAFVVKEDGGVDSLRLKESSGHKVLDNSAMDTVRSVAPFPKPPVAAEIVIPVQFRLQ